MDECRRSAVDNFLQVFNIVNVSFIVLSIKFVWQIKAVPTPGIFLLNYFFRVVCGTNTKILFCKLN